MPISEWRKKENARLKKLLERSNRAKGIDTKVSDREVQATLAKQFNKRIDDKIKTGAALTDEEKYAYDVRLAQSGIAPASTGTPRPGSVPSVGVQSEDAMLSAYANSPTNYDPSQHAPQEFWKTDEFKEIIKKEFSNRATSQAAEYSATRGSTYGNAPLPPDVLARTRGAAYQQPKGILDTITEKMVNSQRLSNVASAVGMNVPNAEAARVRELNALLAAGGLSARTAGEYKKELRKLQQTLKTKETAMTFVGGELNSDDKQYTEAVPFYLDTAAEIKDAKTAYKMEPTVQNWLGLQSTVFASWMSKMFYTGVGEDALTVGGTSEEEGIYSYEQATDPAVEQSKGLMSTLFHAGVYVKDLVEGLFLAADFQNGLKGDSAREQAEKLYAAAEKNPDQAEKLRAKADQLMIQANTNTSVLDEKYKDIENSWQIVQSEFTKALGGQPLFRNPFTDAPDHPDRISDPIGYAEWMKTHAEEIAKTEEQYVDRANMLQDKAAEVYDIAMKAETQEEQELNFRRAIGLTVESIEARRRSGVHDAYGAATWVREPERYEAFMNAAAAIELQSGRQMTTLEVRRLKDMYTNMWTEMAFQMTFDATNVPLIGATFDAIKAAPMFTKYILKPLGVASDFVKGAIEEAPVLGWLTRRMVESVADGKIAPTISDTFTRMLGAYGSNSEAFINDFPKVQSFAEALKTVSPEEAARLFDAAKVGDTALQGLKNISYTDFKKLTDLDIEGLTWKAMTPATLDIFQTIRRSYASAEAFMNDFAKIKSLAFNVQTKDVKIAKKLYEGSKIAGVKAVPFEQFVELAGSLNQSKSWGQMFQESLNSVEAYELRQLRNKAGLAIGDKTPKAMLEESKRLAQKNIKLGMMDFAGKFGEAYKDMHRIYSGSTLLDDTISGQLLRKLRLYGAANDIVKKGGASSKVLNKAMTESLSKVDELILGLGIKSGDAFKKFVFKNGSAAIETIAGIAQFARGAWSTMVLTTPRWIINNYLDSAARSFVYGGNVWDDFLTLMNSTQSEFIDAAGIAPMAFHQQLGKAGINLSNTAIYATVYGDLAEKPKWGILSYWRHEWDRLRSLPRIQTNNLGDLAENISVGLTNRIKGVGNPKLANLWDGFRTVLPATAAAISDYNAAIEFTLRIRMFHREYFKTLSLLEPEFMSRGMEALSPSTRALAEQIWRESRSNPAKITAMINSLSGAKPGAAPAAWAFTLPADWSDVLKKSGMDEEAIQSFTSLVREQVEDFLTTSIKATGKLPTPESINRFADNAIEELQNQTQFAMAQMHDVKDLDMSISTSKATVEMADATTLAGSAPKPVDVSAIQSAIKKLNSKKQAFVKGAEVIDTYTDAISRYGSVVRVPGNGISVMRGADDRLVIEIGEDITKSPEAYNAIHEATIKVMSNQPSELIKDAGFKNADQFETTVRDFLIDPSKVLSDNPKAFKTVMDELDSNPELQKILKQTGQMASYEGAAQVFRRSGQDVFSVDVLNDPRHINEIYQSMRDNIQKVSPARRIASNASGEALVNMDNVVRALPEFTTFSTTYDEFLRLKTLYRSQYEKFTQFVSPGPLTMSLRGTERGMAWDVSEYLIANMYDAEARTMNELTEAFRRGADEGRKALEELTANFPEEFLNRVNVTLEWDDTHTVITHSRITTINPFGDKLTHTWPRGSGVTEWIQANFFKPQGFENVNPLHTITATKFTPEVRRSISLALTSTFDITSEQANTLRRILELHGQTYSKVTGRPIAEYLEKWGFQEIDGNFQLPTGSKFLGDGGIIKRAKDGSYKLFGGPHTDFPAVMRSASVVFLEDLKAMALHSGEAADDLQKLFRAIESATGSKVVKGKLNDAQLQEYTTMFLKYFNGEGAQLKSGFNKMSRWMADAFTGMTGSTVLDDLPQDAVDAMNRMFAQEAMKPKSSGGMAEVIASELAPEMTPSEILNIANNPPAVVSDYRQIVDNMQSNVTIKRARELEALKPKLEELVARLEAVTDPTEKFGLQVEFLRTLDDCLPLGTDFTNHYKMNATIVSWAREALVARTNLPIETINMMGQVEMLEAAQELLQQKPTLMDWLTGRKFTLKSYEEVGDIPLPVLEQILGKESVVSKEMQEAWNVWKGRRDYAAFSEIKSISGKSVLDSPDTFKAYLRARLDSIPLGDLSDSYERMLFDLETFQDSFAKHSFNTMGGDITKKGAPKIDWETKFNVPVKEFQMSDGIKVWVRNNARMVNNLEAGMQSMDSLRKFLLSGEYKAPAISAETLKELKA